MVSYIFGATKYFFAWRLVISFRMEIPSKWPFNINIIGVFLGALPFNV